jgi:hypothetical protein
MQRFSVIPRDVEGGLVALQALLAMPARINAPDSRFAAERLRTPSLLPLSDVDVLPAGWQARLGQLFRTVRALVVPTESPHRWPFLP